MEKPQKESDEGGAKVMQCAGGPLRLNFWQCYRNSITYPL